MKTVYTEQGTESSFRVHIIDFSRMQMNRPFSTGTLQGVYARRRTACVAAIIESTLSVYAAAGPGNREAYIQSVFDACSTPQP